MTLELWNKMCHPPADALKQIKGGRLSGKTDISPQWRFKIMTEVFGTIGVGWKYTIEKIWFEPAHDGQVSAFASILLYVKHDGAWSDAIPGIGGSMYIEKEKSGMHVNDEAPKMCVTDALSVAMKSLGVAAAIYEGKWDGSKYNDRSQGSQGSHQGAPEMSKDAGDDIDDAGMLALESCASLDELSEVWRGLRPDQRKSLVPVKDAMKARLSSNG